MSTGRVPLGRATRLGMIRDSRRKCEVCAWAAPFYDALCVHHIVPVADGGDDALDNLVVLCPNCHAVVHALIRRVDAADEAIFYHLERYYEFDALILLSRIAEGAQRDEWEAA